MPQLTFYDFFAGVGMAEIGLSPAWQCVWANDFDRRKASTYCENHDPQRFVLGDVARVQPGHLPVPATMAWASFPCQDLSLAGWRRGMSPGGRSGAFWEFHRIMRDLRERNQRPPIIVLENVVGLLSGPDFPALCEALAALDMRFGALVMDAARFVPQSRPRVFVVALDDRYDPGPWETPEGSRSKWTNPALDRAHAGLPAVMQARWVWWNLAPTVGTPGAVEHVIEERPTGVEWHTHAETQRLLESMTTVNREKIDAMVRQPGRHVGFLYKRTRAGRVRAEVRFDGIAGCLRTATGGSSRQTVVVIENGQVRTRLLSTREAARLMGLPDSFRLPSSYNEAYHAMGDGVAVPVVAWLGEHLLTPLGGAVSPDDDVHVTGGPALATDVVALQPALLENRGQYDLAGD
jgi:DNA (cytosine-5)-methyltransferase 1